VTTICVKRSHITVNVPVPNDLAALAFGTGIFPVGNMITYDAECTREIISKTAT
jgi:hypothetical protein